MSQVLAALQAGSRGTQACINAASTVSGIIGDLDTTIMFATAGTLHAENEDETFADHRENILKTAKALVEDTKTLVAGKYFIVCTVFFCQLKTILIINVCLRSCIISGTTGSSSPECSVNHYPVS